MPKLLSHSQREAFSKCERYWYLAYKQRLELDTDKPSLRMGRAFALCTQYRDQHTADNDFLEAMQEAASEEQLHRLQDEASIIRVYAEHYNQLYNNDYLRFNVQTEYEFRSPKVGHGFIDAILTSNSSGPRIGIENKLLSPVSWREINEKVLAIDNQVTAYFYAMREQGTPLDHMLYRVCLKPGIKRRRTRQPESQAEYEHRLRQYIAEKQDLFRQYTVYRDDKQLDLFVLQVKATQSQVDLLHRLENKYGADAYPQRTKSCGDYGGCPMLSLCRQEPNAISRYRVRPERPALTPRQQDVLDVMVSDPTNSVSVKSVAQKLNLSNTAAWQYLTALHAKGFVTRHASPNKRIIAWRVAETNEWSRLKNSSAESLLTTLASSPSENKASSSSETPDQAKPPSPQTSQTTSTST